MQQAELSLSATRCLGGTWDQSNLQIQTIADAAEKDRLEWRACREVCNGKLSIGAARSWFTDWRATYRRVIVDGERGN